MRASVPNPRRSAAEIYPNPRRSAAEIYPNPRRSAAEIYPNDPGSATEIYPNGPRSAALDVPGMFDAPASLQTLDAPAPLALAQEPPLHKRVLPWLSLCAGIASAVSMDRGPRRAALVAALALLCWFGLISLHWLVRIELNPGSRWRQRLVVAIRDSSLLAALSLVQLGLFFALPFYWQAARLELAHGLFLLALGLLSAATLWVPFSDSVLPRPLIGPLSIATASFLALNAVLPGLGLSTRASLWLACFIALSGVLLLASSHVPKDERKRVALWALAPCLTLPLALQLGAARAIPPTPLRLVKIAIGTQSAGLGVADRVTQLEAAPAQLFCATELSSPVGLRDRLFHVWRRNGVLQARIELDVSDVYHTRSRLGLSQNGAGEYSCEVQTATGQFLGHEAVTIGPRR